ncbi:hypothetical protein [Pseudomonas sp. PNPG3]|uniref:hypothetical protein n=1 Tax=Pseudomonas sp. PNPG3 TaxID=2919497 RepID=UPI001FFD25E8|nr:hypothetical protein [Pseudomonas sp. PNPG3]MCK2122134.1 hypothetical protein [Pseudomonas sp. PNPG3]
MKISQLVAQYFAVLPIGCTLDEDQVTRNLREAVRVYCGYRRLANAQPGQGIHTPIDEQAGATGDQDFDLTASELAIIEPLWRLKNDKENATTFEASRAQGADPFGKSAAECDAAIEQYLLALPSKCFSFEVRSI